MIRKIKQGWKRIGKLAGRIHKVSDTLKLPIFEKKFIGRLFGLQISGVAMALSMVAYPTQAFDYNMAREAEIGRESVVVTTTPSQYAFPLEVTLGMSQSYHSFHPGIDLRAPRGTAILAIDEGTVVEVKKMFVGYGHYVRIAHNGTMSTLSAHLDKVEVAPGQKVTKGAKIGTVGMTGWSTGPHLHLEVYVGNKAVNPMNYVGLK